MYYNIIDDHLRTQNTMSVKQAGWGDKPFTVGPQQDVPLTRSTGRVP